jgi:peptidoglycan/LPS O-acetylase OafA/YrhL
VRESLLGELPAEDPASDEIPRRTSPSLSRIAALDGLRGITIVLVVLGHGWLLWPQDEVTSIPVVRGFFLGGTVTVFFVIGGYLVARGLLGELDRGECDPLRFFVRRVVRLGVQLSILCCAVLLLARFDPASGSMKDAVASVLHVETYTWNTFLEYDPLSARPDLGHLWYLSVQQQAYLVLPLFLLAFSRRRLLAAVLLAAGVAFVVADRMYVLDELGFWPASLRTLTRADGLLVGVLIAVGMPVIVRAARLARPVFVLAVLGMLALILTSGEAGAYPYLGWWGVAVMLVSGVLVSSIVVHPGTGAIGVLTLRPLARLGKASFSIYLWHYPVFWFLSRHTTDWTWPPRALVAFAVLAVIVVVMERCAEEPVRRLLATHPAFRMRRRDERTETTP